MFDFNLKPGRKLQKIDYKDAEPLISIITPFYKGHNFIEETARCIINQTFPHFEWIIVNDGSPVEGTKEFLEKIKKLDSRIKVYHKKNEGLAATRDYGASKSTKSSKYFVFLDDDDLISNVYLETSYYALETYKDATWAYTDVVNFGQQELLWKKHFDSKIMEESNLLVATAMIRKSAFFDVGGYGYKEKGINEDWLFWLKLISKKDFPIHQSYDGFWYRIKTDGELSISRKNIKVTNKYKKNIVKNINCKVIPIEFPREIYNWENILENKVILPKYKFDDKKKILFIVPWMVVGGADKFNLDFLSSLDKEKHHITLITTQPTESVWKQRFEEVCDEIFELSTFLDCVNWPAFLEYIIKSRNINLIFNTNSTTGYMFLPYLKSLFPAIPIIDYIHMEEWYNRNGGYSRDSAPFMDIIDKTYFCNKNSENIMIQHFGKSPKEVETIYIGVDENKFNPNLYNKEELKQKYFIPKNKKVIGFVARIDYQKRPLLLMEIAKKSIAQNDDLLFLIAGDGPLLKKIKKISKNNHLDKNIKFLGNVEIPSEIYMVSDLTLNCSIKEGLALTSYESLALGTPVISCDVGGQKELINKSVGVIVPCLQEEKDVYDLNYSDKEIESYVDGIEKILSNLEFYQKNCRKTILENFTLQQMRHNLQKEINKIINKADIKKINNGEKLSNFSLILKEFITQYLLGNKGLYGYLCREYNYKIYGKSDFDIDGYKIKTINTKFEKLFCKIHMINEYYIIRNFIYYILSIIKNLFNATFLTLYKIINLFIKRILNFIKKIVRN